MTPDAAAPRPPILVVDDEQGIRFIARYTLEAAGFAVTEAADAAGALALARSAAEPFALILLDLSLPDRSGAELIPELRAVTPESRVLLVSGVGAEEAEASGADGFLAKPFVRATLLDAVRRVLNGQRA